MKRTNRWWWMIAVVLACGEGVTGLGEPTELILEPSMVELRAVGIRTSLSVRALDANGREVALPGDATLGIVEEARTVAELPVVEAATDSHFDIVTLGPGMAIVRARAGELESGTSTITVSPTRPIVARVEGDPGPVDPGDEVVLGGYRMDEVDGLTFGGQPVEVVEAYSESLRIRVPPSYGDDCSGAGAPEIEAENALFPEPLVLRVSRSDEVDLEPGDWRVLGDAAEQCVRLPPDAPSSYTLAFIDARPAIQAMSDAEGRFWSDSVFDIRIADRTNPAARGSIMAVSPANQDAWSGPPLGPRIAERVGRVSSAPEDVFWNRAEPWELGDRVSVENPDDPLGFVLATIVRNYRDRIVVAVLDRDSLYRPGERLALLDEVMESVFEYAIPLFQTALGDGYPVTGGSGQLLVFIGEYSVGGAALCRNADAEDQLPSSCAVIVSASVRQNPDQPLSIVPYVLTHELAHTWQAVYSDHRCRESGDCQGGIEYAWAVEAGADLLALEALRLERGQPLDANRTWSTFSGQIPSYFWDSSIPSIRFGRGYGSAEWFHRHLLWRAVEAGASYETALAAVSRGTFEGWNGYYLYGHFEPPDNFRFLTGRRENGLTRRMRSIQGPEWNPVDALLEATMAYAVDDLTSNPLLQNPSIERVWDYLPGYETPELRTGAATTVEGFAQGWSFGYVRMDDPGPGGSVHIRTSVPNGVYWMLARTR